MKPFAKFVLFITITLTVLTHAIGQETEEWLSLFNKVAGDRAHLFYKGSIGNHDFKNFEFKATVMTKPRANSGIYIHTEYQEKGWPMKGYEVQVNNSQEDWKRTGSLYGIVDIKENYAKDNEWYTEYIKVEGNRIIVKINDIVVVDYTQPEKP
jgi:hypothetical protein